MRKTALVVLAVLGIVSTAAAQQKVRERDLGLKYRDWLKLTAYVILPQEKDVFMRLDNDRDRDIFIESFWKQRDPTPGTAENEYKTELIKRFTYANKEFHKGSPREGWMTDMGKFYIILGPPNSKEDFENRADIYPAQVWYYYGDTSKRLPTYFALVFFKKGGAGEYRLFDQALDQSIDLIIDRRDIGMDNIAAYQKLRELVPELAPLTLSMIPGDASSMYQSTLRSTIIIKDIMESPKKDVNPSYARHFLDFKGIVSTEYLTNFVDSESTIALFHDPLLGVDFLNYSVSPKNISVDFYEPKDQYFCNYTVDVSLRRGDRIFFQDSKEFPFYFDPADADIVKNNGIAIQDSFPVIPGAYRLIILLKNSVGKEFSLVERDIVCEESRGAPRIFGVVVGYKVESARTEVHAPFALLDKRLSIDSKNIFRPEDEIPFLLNIVNVSQDLWGRGELQMTLQGLSKDNPAPKISTLKLSSVPYHADLSLTPSVPAKELAPDYYEMKFSLIDGNGQKIDEKPANFIISPKGIPGRPVSIFKTFPLASAHFYYYILADQYDKTGDGENAELFYKKAYEAAPEYKEGVVGYAEFMVRRGKFEEALMLADQLAGLPKLAFSLHLIKGQAWQGLGQFAKAIDALLEANKIYDSDTRVLNSLGFCLMKTGDRVQALRALNASLKLNPDQPDVKKMAESLSRE
jgi:GWxTD domain-containing protein